MEKQEIKVVVTLSPAGELELDANISDLAVVSILASAIELIAQERIKNEKNAIREESSDL